MESQRKGQVFGREGEGSDRVIACASVTFPDRNLRQTAGFGGQKFDGFARP